VRVCRGRESFPRLDLESSEYGEERQDKNIWGKDACNGPVEVCGTVGNPLRGWIGCIDGNDLKGVRVDALSSDGKDRLASTITNSKGRFVFPNLEAGTYHLAVKSRGLERVDAVVTTNPRSQDALCLVAAGTTGR
jgi:hypothetical protein